MRIDRHNCEAFFLDYHEGSLSPVAAGEVLLFLEENPDLKGLFEEYENISLQKENIPFPGKDTMGKKYSAEGIEALLASGVTPDNCDQFFIAFVEGQLSAERISRLNTFLENNPALKREFELFKQSRILAENISFEEKYFLKRYPITKENREEYFIRAAEKDLSRAEEEQLKLFIEKNPEYKRELELFTKAILPVETIIFADKSSLKKKERRPVVISIFSQRTAYYAAAAAILLLVGLFFIFRNDEPSAAFVAQTQEQSAVGSRQSAVNSQQSAVGSRQSAVGSQQSAAISHAPSRSASAEQGQPSAVRHQPSVVPQPEEKKLQPVVTEDKETLLAENEAPKLEMMKEEDVALKVNSVMPAAVSAVTAQKAEEYQTLGSFARGKIRSALGISKSEDCGEPDDKLTIWDFAMAAKGGIQKLVGTKVDVSKVCDGTGENVEYIFAAGNFEISKSVAR